MSTKTKLEVGLHLYLSSLQHIFLFFYFSHLAGILVLFLEMLILQNLKILVNHPTYPVGKVVNMAWLVYHSPRMFLLMVFQSRSNIATHVCFTVHQGALIAQSATIVLNVSIITVLG